MRLAHQLAEPREVAVDQRARRELDTGVLRDHVAAAPEHAVGYGRGNRGQLLGRRIAQRPDCWKMGAEHAHAGFAVGAARVVLARRMLVLHHRVAHDHSNRLGQRKPPARERTSVEHHRVARPRVARDHLVHHSTPRTHVRVFGALAGKGQRGQIGR